jgi:predicted secreted protein
VTRIIVVLAVLSMLLVACGGDRVLTVDDAGERVSLSQGDELRVTLEGNATTGFIWELSDYDPAVIAPLGEPVYADAGGDRVGAPGEWTWTLRAVGDGESAVSFVYHRTWEDDPPASAFSFTAAVGG